MSITTVDALVSGFPIYAARSFLGWSSSTLVAVGGRRLVVDTSGFTDRCALLDALRARGTSGEDVDVVILTHLHLDHVANIDLFPRARILVHADEWAARAHAEGPGSCPAYLLDWLDASRRMELIRGETADVLPGVTATRAPGHTPGSLIVVFNHRGQAYTIAGDTVKNRYELQSGTAAAPADPARSAEAIKRIRATADVVIPGHDVPIAVHREGLLSAPAAEEWVALVGGERIWLRTPVWPAG